MSDPNSAPSVVATFETPHAAGMALSRGNLILILLLLVQLALSIYLFWPSADVQVTGEPLLANIATDDVTALTITDEGGRSVSFEKAGDLWTLAGTDGYPAREEKVTETLDKLTAIATDRLVTQTSGSHDRLQVAEDNYLRKVDITASSGVQTLYLGSSSGVSAIHVRASTSDATYLTSEIASWELDTLTTTWIEVSYFQVPREQIREVTLENAHGTVTFIRSDDGNGDGEGSDAEWTLADAAPDEPIAPANINTLIDRVATLNLHSVLGTEEVPEYGLDAPLATLTVITSEATTSTAPAETKTTTLVIGAKDEETNTYYLKSSDSEFYVRLASFTGDEFVNKQRSDFMTSVASTEDPAAEVSVEPTIEASAVATETGVLENPPAVTAPITATAITTTTESLDATVPTTTTGELESDGTGEPVSTPTSTN